MRPPPRPTLFPYTTLFRSRNARRHSGTPARGPPAEYCCPATNNGLHAASQGFVSVRMGVRVTQEPLNVIAWTPCRAHRRAEVKRCCRGVVASGQSAAKPVCQIGNMLRPFGVRGQDDELVSTQAINRVGGPDDLRDPPSNLDEDGITGRVSVRVVDPFE